MLDRNTELMTPTEVAKLLKVSVNWVYARTHKRSIPMRKMGGHVRIPRHELMDWIDAGCPDVG